MTNDVTNFPKLSGIMFSSDLLFQFFNFCPKNPQIQEELNGNVVSTLNWVTPVSRENSCAKYSCAMFFPMHIFKPAVGTWISDKFHLNPFFWQQPWTLPCQPYHINKIKDTIASGEVNITYLASWCKYYWASGMHQMRSCFIDFIPKQSAENREMEHSSQDCK